MTTWLAKMEEAAAKIASVSSADPWLLRLERVRGKIGDDGIERVTTQTDCSTYLEVAQRSRGAGACRRLSKANDRSLGLVRPYVSAGSRAAAIWSRFAATRVSLVTVPTGKRRLEPADANRVTRWKPLAPSARFRRASARQAALDRHPLQYRG